MAGTSLENIQVLTASDLESENFPGEQISHSIPMSKDLYLPDPQGKQSNKEVAARFKLDVLGIDPLTAERRKRMSDNLANVGSYVSTLI